MCVNTVIEKMQITVCKVPLHSRVVKFTTFTLFDVGGRSQSQPNKSCVNDTASIICFYHEVTIRRWVLLGGRGVPVQMSVARGVVWASYTHPIVSLMLVSSVYLHVI